MSYSCSEYQYFLEDCENLLDEYDLEDVCNIEVDLNGVQNINLLECKNKDKDYYTILNKLVFIIAVDLGLKESSNYTVYVLNKATEIGVKNILKIPQLDNNVQTCINLVRSKLGFLDVKNCKPLHGVFDSTSNDKEYLYSIRDVTINDKYSNLNLVLHRKVEKDEDTN